MPVKSQTVWYEITRPHIACLGRVSGRGAAFISAVAEWGKFSVVHSGVSGRQSSFSCAVFTGELEGFVSFFHDYYVHDSESRRVTVQDELRNANTTLAEERAQQQQYRKECQHTLAMEKATTGATW